MKKDVNCSKHRTEEETKYLQTRLKIIEGQVRGVSKMIGEEKKCDDVLIQLLAIDKSIKSLSSDIFRSHLSGGILKEDSPELLDEVMELIGRLN